MRKSTWTWATPLLQEPARMACWGHFGVPVLLFPTSGSDFEEVERFRLIAALGDLIERGRIKVYSVDASAVRAWLQGTAPLERRVRLQEQYDSFIDREVVPRIRQDCQDDSIEPILAGASLGAFAAIRGICRQPRLFRAAVALSGTYDSATSSGGAGACSMGASGEMIQALSPMRSLSSSGNRPELEALRRRQIVLSSGAGGYERPDQSRGLAEAFAAQGVPCRLDLSDAQEDHTWASWQHRLPRHLADLA